MDLNSSEKNKQEEKSMKDHINYEVFKIKATKEEINQHKTNLKQIKKPLWDKIDY